MGGSDFRITVQNDSGQNEARFVKNMNDNERKNTGDDELTPEEKEVKMRTLWVGGVSDQCEEDVLYELFMNAGPLEKLHHPEDKVSKKKKAFAFIVYEHEESIKYAYELLNGIELYGQRLRLQHKETGLGINNRQNGGMPRGGLRVGGGGGQHARSFSTSDLMAGRRDGGSGERGQPADMMGERGRGMQHPADRMMEERGRGFSDRDFNNGTELRGHSHHFQDENFRNQFSGGQSNQFPDPYAQNAPFHVQSQGGRGGGYNQFHPGGVGGYNQQMNQFSRRPYPDFQQPGFQHHQPPLPPREYDPAPPPPLPPMPRDYDRPAPPPPPPRDHDSRDRDRRSSRDFGDYESRDRHLRDGRHHDEGRDRRHRDEGRDSRHRDEGRDSRHRDDSRYRDRSSHKDGGSWHHDNRR